MAGDVPFPEPDTSARSGGDASSWEPYQSPQGRGGGPLRFLRRHSFSITVGAAALALGALIYFSPTGAAPDDRTRGPGDRESQATLSIYSAPTGATVIVGADTAGTTPVTDHSLSAGTYLVTVEKEGYGRRDTVLTVSADQSARYRSRLPPDESVPNEPAPTESAADAQRTRSETSPAAPGGGASSDRPATSSAPSPPSSSAPDNTSNSDDSEAPSPGASGTEEANRLVTGSLVLRATPESTAVRLNDRYEVGPTPAMLGEVGVGRHELTFSRPGYETTTRRVDVTRNDTAVVEVSLAPQTGHLRVLARPWGSIYVNGERRAERSDVWYDTALPAGPHTVTVQHPALGEKRRSVTVVARDTQSVVLDLREP